MADTIIGAQLTLDPKEAIQGMKDFKRELKAAEAEALLLAESLGPTSKEAINAAKRAAELRDQIADTKTLIDAFNPDKKFNAFAGAIGAVTGGFSALQGVMGLVGVESENLEKQLLKVQSAMAITQGLDSIRDSIASVKTLGAQLIQTLGKGGVIGIAIAGVAALVLSISGIFSKEDSARVKAYNDTLKDYQNAAADARQKTIEVRVAFDQAREGVISKKDALKLYNDTLGDSLGKTNDINKAEKILAEKAEVYIKITGLKAQANALFAKSAQQTAEALVLQDKLAKENLSDKGFIGTLKDKVKDDINDMLNDAKDIEKLGADLLRQAGQLSSQFDIKTGKPEPTKTTTTNKGETEEERRKREMLELEKRFQDEYNFIQFQAARQRLEQQKADNDAMITQQEEDMKYIADLASSVEFQTTLTASEQAEVRKRVSQAEADARIATAQFVSNQLSVFADLAGKQTVAGKILAVASATINTYLAASKALAGDYSAYGPAAPFVRAATVASTILLGLKQVREITKVQVPAPGGGGGGGGVPNASAPSPLTPQAQLTTTSLDQNTINQIGNSTVRAYVLDADTVNNRERISRLNRAARLGG